MAGEIFILSAGGGGAGINLEVVGGTTQPSSPKENTVWVNTSTTITSWDFSATQPARRSSNKNFLVYPYDSGASLTSSGVTYTCNTSGHVTANGTATETSYYRVFYREPRLMLDPGTYTLSGCPAQPSGGNAYRIYLYSYNANATIASDYGSGETFTLSERTEVGISINVLNGKTATNAVFKPQLEKASSATAYVKGDATGQVWVKTGSSAAAPIDIDKKNSIILYPNSCYQYVNGAWAAKTAMTFVNGAWKNWAVYLLENGADNTAVTGGWQGKAHYLSADATGREPTISFSGGKMVITQNGSAGSNAGIVYAKNKTDLSGHNKITVTAYSTQTQANNAKLAVWAAEPNDWDGAANVSVAGTTAKTYTLDISALSGEFYIGFTLYQYNGGTLTIEDDLKIE